MSNAQGLDVSTWQGAFDWRGHPLISFAGAKACEHNVTDPQFARNWADMKDSFGNKLVRIAYCFAHPGEAMAPQADTLVQLVRDHGLQQGDHFALDLEVTDGCKPAEVVAFAREFSHRVNKAAPAHRCFGYTFTDFAAPWGLWPAWIADYGTTTARVPPPWTTWWLWQFRGSPLDLDQFNGDKERLLNFARMPGDRR